MLAGDTFKGKWINKYAITFSKKIGFCILIHLLSFLFLKLIAKKSMPKFKYKVDISDKNISVDANLGNQVSLGK